MKIKVRTGLDGELGYEVVELLSVNEENVLVVSNNIPYTVSKERCFLDKVYFFSKKQFDAISGIIENYKPLFIKGAQYTEVKTGLDCKSNFDDAIIIHVEQVAVKNL